MAQSVIINSIVYSSVPSINIPKSGGGTATFYDTSDATATNALILTGATAYISGGKTNGAMLNNGTLTGTISTKAGTYTIPSGYTSGGSVAIASTEQAKITSANIVSGATILGVAGATTNVNTADATATESLIYSGATAYVNGAKITGQLLTPVISQDGTTHVLSIS